MGTPDLAENMWGKCNVCAGIASASADLSAAQPLQITLLPLIVIPGYAEAPEAVRSSLAFFSHS